MGSGFLGWGAGAAAAAGQAIFLRRLSVVGALELSVRELSVGRGERSGVSDGFRSAATACIGPNKHTAGARSLSQSRVTTSFAPVILRRGESTLSLGFC